MLREKIGFSKVSMMGFNFADYDIKLPYKGCRGVHGDTPSEISL